MSDKNKLVPIETFLKNIDELRRIGPVRARPCMGVHVRVFGVGKAEMAIALEAFYAFMGLYKIRGEHIQLLCEAIKYQHYHILSKVSGIQEVTKCEALDTKIKWQ